MSTNTSPTTYTGWKPGPDDTSVPHEPSSISAIDMWTNYIKNRKPVVLDGFPDDPEWRGERWTDLAYLRDVSGDASVKVEPIHPEFKCFGTSMPRKTMKFGQFLDLVQDAKQAGRYYLTTQYEENRDDSESDDNEWPSLDPILPSPTHTLKSDLPMRPRILGDLVLQQCNFWVGSGMEPKSSGLHHDFHDNLYILLSGHKRFVLFPPDAYPYLHLRGHVEQIHKNGLLVYEEAGRIRPDGLDVLDAAHWRLASRSHQMGQRKKRRSTNDEAHNSYAEAKMALQELKANYEEDDDDDNDESLDDDQEDDDEGGVLDSVSEAGSELNVCDDDEQLLADLEFKEQEPPSFSRIPTSVLHKHFGIEPSIAPSSAEKEHMFVPLQGCPKPIVVELNPGQMLYLPASWFHEVTSSSSGVAPHMALNYWMHPPDGEKNQVYTDTEVWESIQNRVYDSI